MKAAPLGRRPSILEGLEANFDDMRKALAAISAEPETASAFMQAQYAAATLAAPTTPRSSASPMTSPDSPAVSEKSDQTPVLANTKKRGRLDDEASASNKQSRNGPQNQ